MSNKINVGISVIIVSILLYLFSGPKLDSLHIPPHIRDLSWALFIVSGLVLLFFYIKPHLDKEPENNTTKNVLEGKIIEYRGNRIGDVDKLLISTREQKYWVHFPPHAAKQVMNAAAKGDIAELTVRPTNKLTTENEPLFELVVVQNQGSSLYIESLQPPPAAVGKTLEITASQYKFKLDEKGIISGLIVDKYLIDIPPHIVQNILPVIKQAKEIVIKGYERNEEEGFVNITGLIVIKPYAISADKTDYLL